MFIAVRSAVSLSRRSLATRVTSGPQYDDAQTSDQARKKKTKLIDKSKVPEVDEDDLMEKYVMGTGPGGQSVNKSVNACQIKHVPTGIVIKVHQSRSLEENRKIARELIQRKLDNLYNGEDSVEAQKKRLAMLKRATRESQSEKRRQMKEQFRNINQDEMRTNKLE